MNKETIKTIGWWVFALSIIALIAWGGHSCSKQQKAIRDAERAQREYDELQKLLSDKFLYQDINGVYHLTHDCGMLNDIYWTSDEDEKRGNYSSQYISRDSITDWYQFAATHQLCSECFTPELIRLLDSVKTGNIAPYMRRKGRLSSPLEKQHLETEDELYRDADEEYYNVTPPRDIVR